MKLLPDRVSGWLGAPLLGVNGGNEYRLQRASRGKEAEVWLDDEP